MPRLLIVGAGKRSVSLLRQLPAEADLRPLAVVEPERGRREAALGQFGIAHGFPTLGEFLASGVRVDAALVLTPPALHAEPFVQCVRAGLPVFCEKPMDMDLAACERMLLAARASGVPTAFGFNRRFTPAARLAAALRAERAPVFVHTSKSRAMSYSRMLAENAVHAVDLLLWLARSTPAAVGAVGRFKDEATETEGFIAASVAFVSGGAGSVQMITSGQGSVERLEVYAEDFTLQGDLPDVVRFAGAEAHLRSAAAEAGLALEDLGAGRWRLGAPCSDAAAELLAFVAALGGGHSAGANAEAAFEAQRLVEGIYRAAGLPPSRPGPHWVRES